MIKFKILLLAILLIATKSNADILGAELEMAKGQPAPFAGVLIDEKSYRFYVEQEILAKDFDRQLSGLSALKPEIQENDTWSDHALKILLGFCAGFITSELLDL